MVQVIKVKNKMFDINKESTQIWATYIEGRSPKFKVYNNRRFATSAIKESSLYQDDYKIIPVTSKLYKLVDNKWQEIDYRRTYQGKESILKDES